MSSNKDYEFNERIHSILINPYLTSKDFDENIFLIKKYNIRNISTSLNFLKYIKDTTENYKIKISTLISYPFGDLPNKFLKELMLWAIDNGADAVEYTPKFFLLAKNEEESFALDIENLSKLNFPITLIFNQNKMDEEIFSKAIKISLELGIKSYQFGDGFSKYIDADQINSITKSIGNNNLIKIVGGIKTIKEVKEILDSGANCIGTSYFHNIFQDLKNN
tara:strand:+ start:2985 stop:3647 length:663 start_codon:yes stop_codon:yes gene_type:complete